MMKKTTYFDFEKSQTKEKNRWLGWLSLCLMVFLGSLTSGYGQGNTCIDPLTVTSLPYTFSGNTSTYGDDYDTANIPAVAPGAIVTGTSYTYYLSGDDVVFTITPSINGTMTVNTSFTATYGGVFVFTGCPFTSTLGYNVSSAVGVKEITNLPVLANTTYYIVVSTWTAPQSSAFTLNITGTPGLLTPPEACTGMPSGGTASLTPSGGNAGATFTAKATGSTLASGLTYQWQKNMAGTWQDIVGATTLNSQIVAELGAVGTTTDYRLKVTCTASGQSAFSTTTSYTISLTYCTPTGGGNNADEIKNFTLSNLNNTSAPSEGVAGYKDYSSLVAPAQLSKGTPYIASVTGGTGSGNHGAAIWIDYNQNGTFETTEKVAWIGNTIQPNATVNFPEFIVPPSTPLGIYRLRLQHQYNKSGDLLDPCVLSSTLAETEDYSVQILAIPTCIQPSSLTVANVTSSSAALSWTSNGASFELQWGPQGFALGSVASINVTSLTYPITSGLVPNTSYSYYVRQNCGATDGFSLWSGPFTFKTLCGPMPTLFENFDSYAAGSTTPMPSCWERVGNSSIYISSGSVAPNSVANRLYMSANGTAATPTQGFAIMPPFSNLQASTHRLKFKAYCSTTNKTMEIGYFTNMTDLSSFVSIQTINLPGTAQTTTQEFSIEPTGIPAGVSSLVFRNNAPTGSTTIYIDDVSWQQLPLCPDVVVVSAQTFASTTATITWQPGGGESTWQYVVAPATVTDPSTLTPIVTVSNNPVAMLTNLAPATAYKIWIRSTCAAGLGNWPQNPFTFTTTCAAVTAFSENFDSYTAVGSANPIGNCWTRFGNTGNVYLSAGSVSPLSAPNRLYLNASATGTSLNAIAVMPPVSNLQAGTHRLKFKAFATAAAKILEIGYYELAGDPTSFIVLEVFDLPSTIIANATEFYYTPQFVPAGIESLAFRNNGVANTGSTTMYIDNVVWEPIPPCFDISVVTFSNIAATSVDVQWETGGSESKWEYVYAVNTVTSPVGLTPTVVIDNPSAFIDTNLTPSTTYNFWIRSRCPDNGVGNWSTVKTFTTACAIVETFSENFDTSLTGSTNPMPLCWERAGNGSTYVNTGGALPGTPPNRLYMFASGTATVPTVGYAIMPPVSNLQVNTHRLKFKAYASTTGKYLEIGYFTTSGDLSTFTLLETVNLPGTTAAIAQTFTYDPSNIPAGINSLVFRNPGTPTSSTTAYIDDVTWQAKPTVVPVCATNVTAVPNSQFGNYPTVITWNANPAVDGYYLQMGTTSGGVDVLNNVDIGSVTSYSFTGNVATTYYYTIIPYNNVGPAVGCTQYSFTTNTTGGYCPSVPTSNDGQGVSNVMLGNQNFTSGDVMTVDHTATPVSLAQGITSNLKITLATGATYNTNVWIDLNNNFNFEENELVFQGDTPSTNPTVQDASFMMPQNAPLGPHRMRIVTTDFLQTPANPCYSGTWGVRLDFTVNVTPAPSCLAPLGVSVDVASITTNTATVNWSASTTVAAQGYAYYYSTSNVAPTASTTPSGTVAAGITMVNLTGLATSSLHYFYVRAICSNTDSSAWSQAVSFTTLCDTTTLPYLIDFEAVTVPNLPVCTVNENIGTGNNWITAVSPGSGFTSKVLKYTYNSTNAANTWFFTNRVNLVAGTTYSVSYKYGTTSTTWTESLQVSYGLSANSAAMTTELANHPTINTVGVQLNTATFTPATSGTYVIGFRAYSITNQLNLYVDDILVQLPLATGEFNTSKFVAYPNPVKNYLTIRYNETIKDVTVFNLLGQQLFVKNINATEGQIDMSNLASGTYLLKVNSGDKVQTMKVIKE